VHPDDVDTIGDLSCLTAERGVMIVGDAAVEPGGCVLDAGLCSIDAQISTALDRVRQELGA
jgi:flagellar biosynthesis/type III secretory pathway protein FliH